MLFQSFTMSPCQPSPKCAERRGCSQVLGFLWKPGEKREMGWERDEADS